MNYDHDFELGMVIKEIAYYQFYFCFLGDYYFLGQLGGDANSTRANQHVTTCAFPRGGG